MKKTYLLFTIFFALLISGSVSAAVINVSVDNFFFSPGSFDAAVGDTVVWTLISGTHTTTSTSVPPGAPTWNYQFTGPGDTFSYVITVPGVYEYICTFHPTTMLASFSTEVPFPFIEDFDFPAGDLLTWHGWTAHSAAGTNPQFVNDLGLSFPGYLSSGIGLSAGLANTSEDTHRLFPSTSTGTVYAAFMVSVQNAPNGYFIHYAPNPHNTFDFRGRVWINGGASNFSFGYSFGSSDTTFTPFTYNYSTTYCLVSKYEVVAGTMNDIVSLYIFDPSGSFPPTEPANPTIGPITNLTTQADIDPGSINLRQYNSSQNIFVDGIRIGTTWSQIIPVELTSFTARVIEDDVTLDWVTASETNNSGFDIERKTANESWQKINFVPGHGTTSERQSYSYTDKNLVAGNYSYRLKQVDYDGSYEYSDAVEVTVNPPAVFELSQNYPNPFNPSTTIKFSIPKSTNVTLKVFNALGQEVKTLVNGFVEAGSHTVNFNSEGLNSGLYLYRLQADEFTQVRKMTLLK
ncbi:MAG: hypothetical protein Kow0098_00540 [Ignavibacteriaceae bacterium]